VVADRQPFRTADTCVLAEDGRRSRSVICAAELPDCTLSYMQ
jgi:hypothetical protein